MGVTFTHMAIDIAILTLLSSIRVEGKTWALPLVRVVAKPRALRCTSRCPLYPQERTFGSLDHLVGGQMHFFETVSPRRSPPVVGAMLRVSLVMGPPRISLVIGQCMSLVVGPRIWLIVGPRI